LTPRFILISVSFVSLLSGDPRVLAQSEEHITAAKTAVVRQNSKMHQKGVPEESFPIRDGLSRRTQMLGQGQLLLIKNNPRRSLRPGNVGSSKRKDLRLR
jgi:hypothetical protein